MSVPLLVQTALVITIPLSLGPFHSIKDVRQESPSLVLPAPRLRGPLSVEEALLERRSVRHYAKTSLTLQEIAQLCWAAQGRTGDGGLRTNPSAGALYPLEIMIIAENVEGAKPGTYRYRSSDHDLSLLSSGSIRRTVAEAALGQECLEEAPAIVVITAVPERTTRKYGERGIRYVHMEAGHVAQSIALEAVALELGMVTVGAFQDEEVGRILGLPKEEKVLYLLPVGHPAPER